MDFKWKENRLAHLYKSDTFKIVSIPATAVGAKIPRYHLSTRSYATQFHLPQNPLFSSQFQFKTNVSMGLQH